MKGASKNHIREATKMVDLQSRVDELKRGYNRAMNSGFPLQLNYEGQKYYLDIVLDLEKQILKHQNDAARLRDAASLVLMTAKSAGIDRIHESIVADGRLQILREAVHKYNQDEEELI